MKIQITLTILTLLATLLWTGCGQSNKSAQFGSSSFPCNHTNSRLQTSGNPSSIHSVALSWNASTSLATPPASGEGYNLYRLNPGNSCTLMNKDLIPGLGYEDDFVELGMSYRYAATAVKQGVESGPSNVADVLIPPQ